MAENFDSSISYTTGRVEIFYNGQWGTVCSRSVNKATADALCAEVTGDDASLTLAHGSAGNSELPYVVEVNNHCLTLIKNISIAYTDLQL